MPFMHGIQQRFREEEAWLAEDAQKPDACLAYFAVINYEAQVCG